MKTKVAMMFGGKTVEHEVSVISGIQACMAMDTDKYEIIPVYMTKENDMYIGEGIGDIASYKDIPGLLAKSQRVIMINDGTLLMTKRTYEDLKQQMEECNSNLDPMKVLFHQRRSWHDGYVKSDC